MKQSFAQALKRIEKDYKNVSNIHETYRDASSEYYLELFAIIQRQWNRKKSLPESDELRKFAYAGTLYFSRWYLPSPFILPDRCLDHYSKFLTLLKRTGSHQNNVVPLELQKIKNDIFHKFHLLNLEDDDGEIAKCLDELETMANSILFPSHPKKAQEFIESKDEILTIINSLRNQTITATLKTTLPFPAVNIKTEVEFVWNGLPIKVEVSPSFSAPDNLLVSAEAGDDQEAIIINSMPSKWQYGKTKICISLPCLADHALQCPPLTWLSQERHNEHGWPSTYSIAFNIIERVCWHLSSHEHGFSQYLLNPSDLSSVEHSLFAGEQKIFSLVKGHPGESLKLMFRKKEDLETIYIKQNRLSYPTYSQRCRKIAENYLASGESNNSIIWLNIALEALIKERISLFSIQCGQPELEDVIYKEIDRFDETRELINKQCPDIASQIVWPKSTYSPSIWKIIKRLSETIELNVDLDLLSAQYRRIQKNRGATVHGEESGVISAQVVKEATESYDWIERQFMLKQ